MGGLNFAAGPGPRSIPLRPFVPHIASSRIRDVYAVRKTRKGLGLLTAWHKTWKMMQTVRVRSMACADVRKCSLSSGRRGKYMVAASGDVMVAMPRSSCKRHSCGREKEV